jgi:hypothetical protein
MGRLRQAKRVGTLVAPRVVNPLAALLPEREQPTWRSQARAAAVRAVQFLVMALALAALVGIAVAGYEMVR